MAVLRMENLDTDLPLPPEAVPVTAENLTTAASNSWLPFTGDLDLRAAISEFLAARAGHRFDPEREIVITSAAALRVRGDGSRDALGRVGPDAGDAR